MLLAGTFLLAVPAHVQAIEECILSAAYRYQVSDQLLLAIAKVESGYNPNAINRNRNGTYDMGVMQINSSWLPKLGKYGIHRSHLFDPCTNIHVGAWILANNAVKYGYNWHAVSAYNTGHPTRGIEYARKVLTTVYAPPSHQSRGKRKGK